MRRFRNRKAMGLALLAAMALALCATARADDRVNPAPQKRNTLLFVADGLRNSAVNTIDAPTMMKLRARGVEFTNSHSLFPTSTMPNASAIATGHGLGDTGVFTYAPFTGFIGVSNSPFAPLENDIVERDTNLHAPDKLFLGESTLLAAARAAGFHTAAIGKHGPALLQDVTMFNPDLAAADGTSRSIIIDDVTGTAAGVPLPESLRAALLKAGLPDEAPSRGANAITGNFESSGTSRPNTTQQAFFLKATTDVILPAFISDAQNANPFLIVYWSRDPDGSQHDQGDNFNVKSGHADTLGVGINGPTARAGIQNADSNLAALLDYLDKTDDPHHAGQKLSANTNVFVTSDHGFGTISRHELPDGKVAEGFSAKLRAVDTTVDPPQRDTVAGFLPPGFLAMDLAEHLKLPMFDAGPLKKTFANADRKSGTLQLIPVNPHQPPFLEETLQHPDSGSAVLGGNGTAAFTISDKGVQSGTLDPGARLCVSASGGSDLLYLPNAKITNGKAAPDDIAFVKDIVAFLGAQNYVGGIFVDADVYGNIPGAIPFAAIGLNGSGKLPRPAIIVSFATFSMDPKNPLYTGVEIADSTFQEGQGMHGSFARFDTFNNMIAFGPDFKAGPDADPVSNADIAPTLAYILGLKLPPHGSLTGRVLEEALSNGGILQHVTEKSLMKSDPTPGGFHTDLRIQTLQDSTGNEYHYFDWAGMPGRVVTGE